MTGIVIRVTGSWHDIRLDDGTVLPSRIIGRLRLDDIRTTNPVGVGDRVEVVFEQDQPGQGVITEVLPRRNYVVRQSPRKKHELHLLAANVEQAILVTTIIRPSLKLGFIDRFLLMTEPHDIPVTIVINKNDLFGESEAEIFGGLQHMYESIGYGVISVSAATGDGIPALKALMKDKVSLIAGQSGVGKSSLINAIQPGLVPRCSRSTWAASSSIRRASRCCRSTISSRWMSRTTSASSSPCRRTAGIPVACTGTNPVVR